MPTDWYKLFLSKNANNPPPNTGPSVSGVGFGANPQPQQPSAPWYDPFAWVGSSLRVLEKVNQPVTLKEFTEAQANPTQPFVQPEKVKVMLQSPLENLRDFGQLPLQSQLAYEAPALIASGLVPGAGVGTALWQEAGNIPNMALRVAAKVPLAPLAGAEQLLAKGTGLLAKLAGKAVKTAVKPYMRAETLKTATAKEAQVTTKTATAKLFEGVETGKPVTRELHRGVGEGAAPNDYGKYGRGEYWSSNPETASWYAEKKGGQVISETVNFKNPYVIDESVGDKWLSEVAKRAEDKAIKEGKDVVAASEAASDAVAKAVQRKGYTSLIIKTDQDELEIVRYTATKEAVSGANKVYADEIDAAVQHLAATSATKREFLDKLYSGYKNPRGFVTRLNNRYGNVENYMKIARANELEVKNSPVLAEAKTKIIDWIRSSTAKWEPTKKLRSAEIAKKIPGMRAAILTKMDEGQDAMRSALGAAKGKLPFAKPTGLPITAAEEKAMFNAINIAYAKDVLREYEHINASTGLEKILGGQLPQISEMVQLEKVFGGDLINALLSRRGFWSKVGQGALDVVLLPRTILASGDWSAPLRQGLYLLPSHPAKASSAFVKSVRMFFDPKYYKETVQYLMERPTAKLSADSGLFLGSLRSVSKGLMAKEEAFMSGLADKIPGLKQMVDASERAYVGYLDTFRASVFDSTVRGWGLKLAQGATEDTVKLARYINWATGRGWAPKTGQELLNAAFFSPRLITSRIGMPFLVTKMLASDSPALRKIAARDLVAFLGAMGTALGLAHLGGAEVTLDPRSADFGKVKIGNTRIDLLGGFGQYVVFVSRMLSKETRSASGRVIKINRADVMTRMLRTKASPVIGMMWNYFAEENVIGEPVNMEYHNILRDIKDGLMPMAWQDIYDAMLDSGWEGGLMALPALVGAGVQTYDSAPQVIGEVNYLYSQGQLANTKLRELEMKRDFMGAQKFRLESEDISNARLVARAYGKISSLEKQKKAIELDPMLTEEVRKERLNEIEQRQIETAIPTLLAVDRDKLSRELRKKGIDTSKPLNQQKSFSETYYPNK